MRFVLGLFASLSLVTPADAGIVARYAASDGQRGLSIEVGEAGEARISPDRGDFFSLFNASGNFIVLRSRPDEAGRYEDYQALMANFVQQRGMAAALEALARMRGEKAKFPLLIIKTKPSGTETIAGHTGTVYKLITKGAEHAWRPPEVVVSTEDQLRPLGTALATYLTNDPEEVDVSPERRNPYTVAIAELLKSGALIRGRETSLVSLQQVDFSEGHFATPAKILSREELAQRLAEAAASRPLNETPNSKR